MKYDQTSTKVTCMTKRLLYRMICLVYVNLYYCKYIAWLEGIHEHAIRRHCHGVDAIICRLSVMCS